MELILYLVVKSQEIISVWSWEADRGPGAGPIGAERRADGGTIEGARRGADRKDRGSRGEAEKGPGRRPIGCSRGGAEGLGLEGPTLCMKLQKLHY